MAKKVLIFDPAPFDSLIKTLNKLSRQIPFGSPRQKEVARVMVEVESAKALAQQTCDTHNRRLSALFKKSKAFLISNKRSKASR